jgi:hypothetical protein
MYYTYVYIQKRLSAAASRRKYFDENLTRAKVFQKDIRRSWKTANAAPTLRLSQGT